MKKAVILIVFLVLIFYSIAAIATQQVDEIEHLFGSEEEAEVIIVLNDDYNVVQMII